MTNYNENDLKEALRAIESIIAKCEKAVLKPAPGTSQHTLLIRRIAAFQIAHSLIEDKLSGH